MREREREREIMRERENEREREKKKTRGGGTLGQTVKPADERTDIHSIRK